MTALLDVIPNKQNDRLKGFFKTSLKVVRKIMIERQEAIEMGESADKDVLSVLCTFPYNHKICNLLIIYMVYLKCVPIKQKTHQNDSVTRS